MDPSEQNPPTLHQSPVTQTCLGKAEPATCTVMEVKECFEDSTQPVHKCTTEEQLKTSDKLRLMGNIVETVAVIETRPRSCSTNQDDLELQKSPTIFRKDPEELKEPIGKQPRSLKSSKEATKLLTSEGNPKKYLKDSPQTHPWPCHHCGHCRCRNCSVGAALLPSCQLCDRRCLCLAETTVEYITCVCCLKALLYHCSSDNEDGSADAPFSCHRQGWCKRWSAAAAMATILPCLLCYGPLRGCLVLCQLCHQHANRSGCRCKNVKT